MSLDQFTLEIDMIISNFEQSSTCLRIVEERFPNFHVFHFVKIRTENEAASCSGQCQMDLLRRIQVFEGRRFEGRYQNSVFLRALETIVSAHLDWRINEHLFFPEIIRLYA